MPDTTQFENQRNSIAELLLAQQLAQAQNVGMQPVAEPPQGRSPQASDTMTQGRMVDPVSPGGLPVFSNDEIADMQPGVWDFSPTPTPDDEGDDEGDPGEDDTASFNSPDFTTSAASMTTPGHTQMALSTLTDPDTGLPAGPISEANPSAWGSTTSPMTTTGPIDVGSQKSSGNLFEGSFDPFGNSYDPADFGNPSPATPGTFDPSGAPIGPPSGEFSPSPAMTPGGSFTAGFGQGFAAAANAFGGGDPGSGGADPGGGAGQGGAEGTGGSSSSSGESGSSGVG